MTDANSQNIQMTVSDASEQTSNQASQPKQSNQPNGLTLQSLVNVKQLIEIAIKRGAYNPAELSMVGNIYDNFSANVTKMVEDSNKNGN
jgi:hypothetical protein